MNGKPAKLSMKTHIATPWNGRSQPRPSSESSVTGAAELALACRDDGERADRGRGVRDR